MTYLQAMFKAGICTRPERVKPDRRRVSLYRTLRSNGVIDAIFNFFSLQQKPCPAGSGGNGSGNSAYSAIRIWRRRE